MLSKNVINKVLNSGLYFDDDFDFEKNEVVLTNDSRIWFGTNLGIQNINSAFIDYYAFAIGGCEGEKSCLFDLDAIFDAYENPFWGDQYPGIEKKYLQLSSIEGEYSYFYDKETDAMYGVDWDEMDDLIAGKLKPLVTSFYDFLEWYYTEDEE